MSFKVNVLVSLFGASIQRGGALLLSIYLAQKYSFDLLGAYALLLANVQLFSVLGVFGVTPTASKFLAKTSDKREQGALVYFFIKMTGSLAIILGLAVCFFSSMLAENVYGKQEYEELIIISAPVISLSLLIALGQGILYGFNRFRAAAKINVVSGGLLLLFIPVGIWLYDAAGMAYGMLIAHLIVALIYFVSIKSVLRENGVRLESYGESQLGILLNFSLPSLLVGASQSVANWVVVLFLLNVGGEGAKLLAVYHIVNQWYSLVLFLPNVASGVLLPMLAKSKADQTVKKVANVYFLVGLVCALVLSLMSPLIELLYGEEFAGSWPLLVVTFVTGALVAYKSPFEQYLNANDFAWSVAIINFIFSFFFIFSLFILLNYGLLGVLEVLFVRLFAYFVYIAMCLSKSRSVMS